MATPNRRTITQYSWDSSVRSIAVSLATIAVLVGCVARSPVVVVHHDNSGPAVAWVDRPAHPPSDPPPPHDAPSCRRGALAFTHTASGGALGTETLRVYFVNRTKSACVVRGYLRNFRHGALSYGPVANLAAGRTVTVDIDWSVSCAKAQHGHHAIRRRSRLVLPSGQITRVRGYVDAVCGVWASRFGVPSLIAHDRSNPLRISYRHLHLVAKNVLGYVVTLRDPTARPFSLEPCPTYEEYAYARRPHGYADLFYHLNCDAVHSIAPHSAVSFQMRLRVPPAMHGQDAKFDWLLMGYAAHTNFGVVTVP